jgi:uncharacterized protein (TIGR00304 family)
MVGVPRWLPIALLAGGAVLIGDSIWSGATRVYLLVVFPVLSGATPGFLLGVVLLIAGFFLLPFLLSIEEDDLPRSRSGSIQADRAVRPSSGGVVIVGPVPIFLGGWRGASTASYVVAAAVGVLLTAVVVLLLLGV